MQLWVGDIDRNNSGKSLHPALFVCAVQTGQQHLFLLPTGFFAAFLKVPFA